MLYSANNLNFMNIATDVTELVTRINSITGSVEKSATQLVGSVPNTAPAVVTNASPTSILNSLYESLVAANALVDRLQAASDSVSLAVGGPSDPASNSGVSAPQASKVFS